MSSSNVQSSSSSSPSSSSNSPSNPQNHLQQPRNFSAARSRVRSQPYIPSYMDLKNGLDPCVVCGDAATGFHYRQMTCEGCKGFFRRTIQKQIHYECKTGLGKCPIDKNSRNACQKCRFQKCVSEGMAIDLVLSEDQRQEKQKLIAENRQRRHLEFIRTQLRMEEQQHQLSEEDRQLCKIVTVSFSDAVDQAAPVGFSPPVIAEKELLENAVSRLTRFALQIPGFIISAHQIDSDNVKLLAECRLELLYMLLARQYDLSSETVTLPNDPTTVIHLDHNRMANLVEFCSGIAKLQLDETEMALLAALVLVNPGNPELKDPERIQIVQDRLITAFIRYIFQTYPGEANRLSKLLMKINELRQLMMLNNYRTIIHLFCGEKHSPS